MKRRFFIFIISFLSLIVTFFSIDLFLKSESEIKIGAKSQIENRILANMMAILIEKNSDLKVEVKTLEGTFVAFQSLLAGDIDIYPEFTGTAFLAILRPIAKASASLTRIISSIMDLSNVFGIKPGAVPIMLCGLKMP